MTRRVTGALVATLVGALAACAPVQSPDVGPQRFASVATAQAVSAPATVAHLSLHHAARPKAIGRYVAKVAAEGATVITTTETNRPMTLAVRTRLGDSWRVTRQGEYLIAWERGTWYQSRVGIVHHRRLTFVHSGRDAWRDNYQGARRLVHRETQTPVRFAVSHDPSAVQKGDEFRTDSPRQVAAWKQAQVRQGKRVAGSPSGVVQVLTKDSNVDHHRKVWRSRTTTLVGLPTIWDAARPFEGTHRGRRLIDVGLATVLTSRARLTITPPPRGVDHHGIRFRIHLPRSQP